MRGLLEGWRADVEAEPLAPGLDVPAMRLGWLASRGRDRARPGAEPARRTA
ncbi:hypothetical protein [Amycolatopsis rubida]|uniref:Uncharacterized protein n=1 Tax=Amycolatopsis rubida TaxID=112413 RepID=A0A1I6AI52_9PSEU|nr:hypothetical protein [Amycolatopsis rubida]SFQ68335.1 hypothetical protein SAMN05421854_11934 [Amycolatopsis rubida]